VIDVTTTARRGSPAALLHRVDHPRGAAEWLVRVMPGSCSQHCAVEKLRPAPEKASSPPCSVIVTAPDGAPPPEVGFGPHASPQSFVDQDSVIADALQAPLNVGLVASSARAWAAPASAIPAAKATATAARAGFIDARSTPIGAPHGGAHRT
jgi:hypothetical protein